MGYAALDVAVDVDSNLNLNPTVVVDPNRRSGPIR
jgi:hypothetical protein